MLLRASSWPPATASAAQPRALSLPGSVLGQRWGKEVGGLSCAIGVQDSPAPSSWHPALCALQLADEDTNPPAQILLQWQCTQEPPWVRGAPQPPACIFLKSPDFCPIFWGTGKCTSSLGSVYQQGMQRGSQDLASCPPVGSALSARVAAAAAALAPPGCTPRANQTLTRQLVCRRLKQHLRKAALQCKGHVQTFGSWALLAALTKRLQYQVALEKQGCLASMWRKVLLVLPSRPPK